MSESSTPAPLPWYRQLNGQQWFVFVVASAAWCFDVLDQRLFSLARNPALQALAPPGTAPGAVQAMGKEVTALFLLGWGIGGLIFGALGDRHGRAKMLTVTVLIYSICTGLTYFSRSYIDFALFRFLTGIGVGGVFGLAVALVAETVPDRARTAALGMLQALSAIGTLSAALLKNLFDRLELNGVVDEGWRWMFLIGALPAILMVLAARRLREPETWLRQQRERRLPTGGLLAPYVGLLRDARWRKNLFVGAALASTGVIGLWAIGEYAVDLQRHIFRDYFETAGVPSDAIGVRVNNAITLAFLMNVLGSLLGMWAFTWLATRMGRRPAFALSFFAAFLVTFFAYWKMNSPANAYWMMALMGVAQLSAFAGFAIYLPELFPSRYRSTGASFCYNIGRFAAAAGSLFSARLATETFGSFGTPLMERYSAMAMCCIFLLGLVVLRFAPETRGQPLPA